VPRRLVLDRNGEDAGKVVGILTETDLLRHVAGAEECSRPEVDIIVSYP
jgi:CBS domain-containing protein